MEQEDTYFQSEGGIFDYPKLVPKKFYLNFDPPQIGFHYTRTPKETHKHLFLVQLNNLILLEEPEKITQSLFEKYPAFFNSKIVSFDQVRNLVIKIIEYI